MEAEFMACFEAMIHAKWLWNFISGLTVIDSIVKSLKIYSANSTVVFFFENDKYSKCAKYMEMKYFAVKRSLET
ncbi:hypothetical protein Lal_00012600 [Lupinus albus]|nr:hypothetical protein Lal_00012600 [Lupinus albus]